MSGTGPLSHLRVLDLSRLHPGAFCTRLLADLGADVLRVEQPGSGDPLRALPGAHEAYNHGKRSMTLDVRHQAAPDVVRRLVRGVDVVIENAPVGSLEKRGIGYPQLAADNPGLVWCSITGFGQDSPYADKPAHDITFLGYSGLLGLLAGDGVPGTPDLVLAVPLGALMATVGILAVVQQRDRTGRGSFVDASILDAATWLLSEHVSRVAAGQPAGWGAMASRRAYRCGDGRLVTVAAAEPKTWAAFCAVLDLPDLVDRLFGQPEEQAAMTERVAAVLATRPAAEWVSLLPHAAVGPVHGVEDLLDDPHVRARGSVVTLADGSAQVLRNPLRLLDADGRGADVTAAPVPTLGQHTDEACAAAGLTADDIAALRAAGAI